MHVWHWRERKQVRSWYKYYRDWHHRTCMWLWWAEFFMFSSFIMYSHFIYSSRWMHCIMGKPTTRKPASSSTENSCISREAHAWREALFICVCAWHGVHVHVKLEWFTVEHGLHNITRQIVQKSRQLDDYIDWLAPACSPLTICTYTTHVTKFWVTPSYCALFLCFAAGVVYNTHLSAT